MGNDSKRPLQSLLWEYSGSQEGNKVTDMAVGPNGEVYQTMSWGVWISPREDTKTLPQAQDNVLFAAVATGGKSRVWGVKTDGRIFKYVGNK